MTSIACPFPPGAKSTTGDYRTLDVRRWAREGMLKPGYWGGWQWTRDGETMASIQVRAEQDRVILNYRHRSGDAEWKDEHYAVQPRRFACVVHLPGGWIYLRSRRDEVSTTGRGRRLKSGEIPAHGGQFPVRRSKFPARLNKFPVRRELIPCFIL